jgi:hypothetical protein
MKFFLFRCRACIWKNFVLASPSLSHPTLDLDRAMVRLREDNMSDRFFSLHFNECSSGVRGRLSWAISRWCRISRAKPSYDSTWPTFLSLQACKPLAAVLNFWLSVKTGQGPCWTDFQAPATTSSKPSILGQNDSKWKRLFPALLSLNPRSNGQWSKSSDAALWSRELGYTSS